MAQNLNMSPFVIFLALLALVPTSSLAEEPLRETKMSFYLQDYSAGPNTSALPVAGIAGKLWTYTQFGTVYVIDDRITETPDPNSATIGRCQGISVTAGLDGLNAHVSASIVFTNKQYNGSTLELQGNSKQLEQVREVSVVSGTGDFRFARGYATFETYSLDASMTYAVLRCNVTVRRY